MRLGTRIAAAAVLAILFTQRPSMSSQSAAMAVTATVVRSCAFSQPEDGRGGVGVSCSRGATPGVMVSSSGAVVPVPPGRIVSLPAPAASPDGRFRVVTVNF